MELIVGVASITGALATVLSALVALRGQRRSASQKGDELPAAGSSRFVLPPYLLAELETSTGIRLAQKELDFARSWDVIVATSALADRDEEAYKRWLLRKDVREALEAGDEGIEIKQLDGDIVAVSNRRVAPEPAKRKSRSPIKTTVPSWAMGLMSAEDASRYALEWGAHLHELIEDGQLRQARSDRRALARTAIFLALALRARRALGRAR